MSDVKKWLLRVPEVLKEAKTVDKKDEKGKLVFGKDERPITEVKLVDAPSPIAGTVTVRLLSAKERAALAREMRYKVDTSGELVEKVEEEKVEAMLSAAEKAIVSVDLTRKEDNYKYSGLDELGVDEDGTKILIWVGQKVLNGVKLGKDCVPA